MNASLQLLQKRVSNTNTMGLPTVLILLDISNMIWVVLGGIYTIFKFQEFWLLKFENHLILIIDDKSLPKKNRKE